MKARLVKKVLSTMIVATMGVAVLTGCNVGEIIEETGVKDILTSGSKDAGSETKEDTASDESINLEGEMDTYTDEPDDGAAAGEEVYTDPNGWSVSYDPSYFKVDQQSDKVVFTYTAGKAEPSTVTFKYMAGKTSKDVADEIAKDCNGQITERDDFMYVENVKTLFVDNEPADKKGPYISAFTRDYKDGCFLMETVSYQTGDDMDDMNTSDMISMIMGSLKFTE